MTIARDALWSLLYLANETVPSPCDQQLNFPHGLDRLDFLLALLAIRVLEIMKSKMRHTRGFRMNTTLTDLLTPSPGTITTLAPVFGCLLLETTCPLGLA